MVKPRKSVIAIALLGLLGFLVLHFGRVPRTPLGDGPLVIFHDSELSPSLRQHFLEGNFTLIKRVKALPRPVLQVFSEQGGSRFLLADPGKKFEATDAIDDSNIPQKRLIFAGVLDDKCFVHYEQGGIAHSYVLALFRLTSNDTIEPLWRGYCGPAANIQDLRSQVAKGQCSQSLPRGMR
jgi:hypothetical protein